MIPEDPNAKGWYKSYKGKKFHYFAGKYAWSQSKCSRVHVPIQRLTLVNEDSVTDEQKCQICWRILRRETSE